MTDASNRLPPPPENVWVGGSYPEASHPLRRWWRERGPYLFALLLWALAGALLLLALVLVGCSTGMDSAERAKVDELQRLLGLTEAQAVGALEVRIPAGGSPGAGMAGTVRAPVLTGGGGGGATVRVNLPSGPVPDPGWTAITLSSPVEALDLDWTVEGEALVVSGIAVPVDCLADAFVEDAVYRLAVACPDGLDRIDVQLAGPSGATIELVPTACQIDEGGQECDARAGTVEFPAPCESSLDLDGNGLIEVATDVVYLARHMLGLPPVPSSFRESDPSIPPDGEVSVAAGRVIGGCP